MIKVTMDDVNLSRTVTSPIEIEEQLDLSLDSGEIKYLLWEGKYVYGSSRVKGLNKQLAQYVIEVKDADGNKLNFDFVGIDSRAIIKNTDNADLYSHRVVLTEASKLLQGVLIDGLSVTQPENVNDRKTLYEVVQRLLATTPFDYSRTQSKKFSLTKDVAIVDALAAVKSPEFKWNTQTSVWECLLQIGAVIDAVPRLVADADGSFTVVTFEFVNAFKNEAEAIDDKYANAIGENVEEGQYNTALSSVVENLRES